MENLKISKELLEYINQKDGRVSWTSKIMKKYKSICIKEADKLNLDNRFEYIYFLYIGANKFKDVSICPECNKKKKFGTLKNPYRKYCSTKCSNKNISIETKEKISKSMIEYNYTINDWSERTNKFQKTISKRTKEEKEYNKLKKSKTSKKVHKNRSEKEKARLNKKISISVKNSKKAKDQRHKRAVLGAKVLQEKLSKISSEEYIEYYKKQQISRERTFQEKYSVKNPMQVDKIKKKIFKKNYESGLWLRDDQLEDYELYCRLVSRNQDNKLIKKLENYYKRGRYDLKNEYYHLDHKYSKRQGFEDGILPYVIAKIHNLEFIPGSNNCSKGRKCSITKEQLFYF